MMTPEAKTFRSAEDGKEFTFLFDFSGMIAAENAADKPFAEVVTGAVGGRIGHLGALIYGGLKAFQPKITFAEALAMVEAEGAELGEAMWAALESAQPDKKVADANPPKARGGTGSRSSPRGSKKA